MTDVTIRRWQDHTVWLMVTRSSSAGMEAVATELAHLRSGGTALVDLTDAGLIDASVAQGLRAGIETAVQRGVHVVVAVSDLESRRALVAVDVDHLAPMPQSRGDAMAFLNTVIAQAS